MSTDVDELTEDPVQLVESGVPSGLLIAGEWVDATSGTDLDVVDPATGLHLTTVREASTSDVDAAVGAATSAFRTWRRTSGDDRAGLLERLAGLVERDAEKIATIETLDNGKPRSVARHHDVANAVATLRYFAGLAGTSAPEPAPPVFARRGRPEVLVSHDPLGVVAGVIAWNAPFMTAVWKLAPALAFGNTIVLKPAEDTPLGALVLGALCVEAGFPPGVVNVLPGGGATTGAALVRHRGVAKISFTGSTSVGREIATRAAADFTRVGLELGGKSATIVLADAVRENLDRAVSVALWAVFANSGQVCSAGSRLLVEDTVSDELLDAVARAAQRIRVGGGLDPATQMGPLISERQRERVHGFVTDPGTPTPVVGGTRPDGEGFFYPPTIVLGAGRDARIWREEVFGPVLCATTFDDEQEAVELANDTVYGLAAGVVTHDRARAARIADGLDVGTVWVNAHNVYDPAVPWGGRKQSGLGREIGCTARNAYTEEKAVWFTNF